MSSRLSGRALAPEVISTYCCAVSWLFDVECLATSNDFRRHSCFNI